MTGDCRELLRSVGPVDFLLTDPPFGISNQANSSGVSDAFSSYTSNKGAWDVEVPAEDWVPLACQALKPGGLFACFGTFGSLVPIYQELERAKMQFQSHITWHKTNPAPSIHRRMLTHANEIILMFSKGSLWSFDYAYAKSINGDKQHHNHFEQAAVKRHMGATRKPPALCEKLIRMFSRPGEVILDPFAGSGVVLEEAEKAGRVGLGFEIRPELVLDFKERWGGLSS